MENELLENEVVDFGELLKAVLFEAKGHKAQADSGENTRRWAIIVTELEKVYSYHQTFLKEEE